MGLAGTGLAALEDDYTRNSKYHGEDANTKHGCTGVRYLLVLAGVCITLVLVGIVALVGLARAGTGLIATLARLRGALLNQTRDGIADCLSRSLYVRLGGLTITRQRIRRSDCRIKHGQRFISPLCAIHGSSGIELSAQRGTILHRSYKHQLLRCLLQLGCGIHHRSFGGILSLIHLLRRIQYRRVLRP